MEYNITSGAWLKNEDVADGAKIKLVSECKQTVSRFKDDEGNAKTDNEVKANVEGKDEPVNMRLNWTTIYALVEAFGKDSKDWIGHVLIAKPKDATTGVSLYLIPEGFELVRNEQKRWTIRKTGGVVEPTIEPSEIPF